MAITMHYESLEAKAKQRYRETLSCVILSIRDDPYLPINDSRFVNDMATWPKIEYGDTFGYFITRPGVYTPNNSYFLANSWMPSTIFRQDM